MRKLTIIREKRFVAKLGKMKIYIEDPVFGELRINGIPCRKIGELKNGEEKTFEIGENAAKIFVIADKISRNYSNEYYDLPAGTEDIVLTGRNEFNLATGNAFRFEGNEATAENRRRGTRIGVVVLCVSVFIGLLVGYLIGNAFFAKRQPNDAVFTAEGMSITLTDAFAKTEAAGLTVAYDSENVAVLALKEKFSLMEGFEDYTLDQYGALVLQSNGLDSDSMRTDNGLPHFAYDYTNPETNESFTYYSYIYKSNDAFWLIQFAVRLECVEQYKPQIPKWAESVRFSADV